MICKNCNRNILKTKGFNIGNFCSYPCKNEFYNINERNLKGRKKQQPTKAFIFEMWFYFDIRLRRIDHIKMIAKQIPYLISDPNFKNEIEKCIK